MVADKHLSEGIWDKAGRENGGYASVQLKQFHFHFYLFAKSVFCHDLEVLANRYLFS